MGTRKDNPMAAFDSGEWLLVELPETDYTRARDLQAALVESRKKRLIAKDIVLMLEHSPVFTLGRRGGLENLTVSEEFLEKAGIEVIHAERGGT